MPVKPPPFAPALAAAMLLLSAGTGCGSGSGGPKLAAQHTDDVPTVTFLDPEDRGPDPFTETADVDGASTVRVGATASRSSGRAGSTRVCDRDRLLRFLRANPVRMRAWARTLGVRPTFPAVRRYVARLHPVTLTRDTRIRSHAFQGLRAVGFEAILRAGTAVLVDRHGTPVVRCFCGSPLKPAARAQPARCAGCPAGYSAPRQCRYGRSARYRDDFYRRRFYSNAAYDALFAHRQRRGPFSDCYAAYPDPPEVTFLSVFERPEPRRRPRPRTLLPGPLAEPPSATPTPAPAGEACDAAQSGCGTAPATTPEPAPAPAATPEPTATPAPAPEPTAEETPESTSGSETCSGGTGQGGATGPTDGDVATCP
jgi:hypothetical protein